MAFTLFEMALSEATHTCTSGYQIIAIHLNNVHYFFEPIVTTQKSTVHHTAYTFIMYESLQILQF